MSAGFYKRRRGILEHLEAGRITLLDLAIHDYLNLKANLLVGSPCWIPPGICITSAVAIHAVCGGIVSYKTIQRRLRHLEEIGWIKRFHTPGKHGNFPVLICRASVHDVSGMEYRINGNETIDWRHPKLLPVREESAGATIDVPELSTLRELRTENRERRRKNSAGKPPPPPDSRFQQFYSFAYEAFRTNHGQPPTWSKRDGANLKRFLAEQQSVTTQEWQRRFTNYLGSTESFIGKQGHSLNYFIAHFDVFRVGPVLDAFQPNKSRANRRHTDSLAVQPEPGKYDGSSVHRVANDGKLRPM
jgi:hypothetical protein